MTLSLMILINFCKVYAVHISFFVFVSLWHKGSHPQDAAWFAVNLGALFIIAGALLDFYLAFLIREKQNTQEALLLAEIREHLKEDKQKGSASDEKIRSSEDT